MECTVMYRMRAHREDHASWPDPKEPRLGDERHRPPPAQGFAPRGFRTRASSLSPPMLARAGPSAIPAQ